MTIRLFGFKFSVERESVSVTDIPSPRYRGVGTWADDAEPTMPTPTYTSPLPTLANMAAMQNMATTRTSAGLHGAIMGMVGMFPYSSARSLYRLD